LRVLMARGIDHDSLGLDDPPNPRTEDRVTDSARQRSARAFGRRSCRRTDPRA
jgi:hypothetical protein